MRRVVARPEYPILTRSCVVLSRAIDRIARGDGTPEPEAYPIRAKFCGSSVRFGVRSATSQGLRHTVMPGRRCHPRQPHGQRHGQRSALDRAPELPRVRCATPTRQAAIEGAAASDVRGPGAAPTIASAHWSTPCLSTRTAQVERECTLQRRISAATPVLQRAGHMPARRRAARVSSPRAYRLSCGEPPRPTESARLTRRRTLHRSSAPIQARSPSTAGEPRHSDACSARTDSRARCGRDHATSASRAARAPQSIPCSRCVQSSGSLSHQELDLHGLTSGSSLLAQNGPSQRVGR